jgi:hypothetical protein
MGARIRSRVAALTLPFVLHVVLPLALGTLVYAAYRDRDIHVVAWLAEAGAVDAARDTVGRAPLPRVVVGALPDLAWAWAFGAALVLVWRGKPLREAMPWLAAGAVVALGSEIGQAFGVVPGTFDPVDLAAIAAGFVGGAAVARRAPRRDTEATG